MAKRAAETQRSNTSPEKTSLGSTEVVLDSRHKASERAMVSDGVVEFGYGPSHISEQLGFHRLENSHWPSSHLLHFETKSTAIAFMHAEALR